MYDVGVQEGHDAEGGGGAGAGHPQAGHGREGEGFALVSKFERFGA